MHYAAQSREVFREWGERFGQELVSPGGALAVGPSAQRRLPVLAQAGVDVEQVSGAQLRSLLPLLPQGWDAAGVLDPGGGAIRTVATLDALTAALRDDLVADEVLAVRPTGRETVEVRRGAAPEEHERVVVCAGPGTAPLARGLGLALPVELAAHVRLTFRVRGAPPARAATFQDSTGDSGETGVYGAPTPDRSAYAVGLSGTVATDDGGVADPPAYAALAERAAAYVARALPGLDPDPVEVRHCWVTSLPWGEDGLAVWERDGVLLTAGHNLWKQAPGLGQRLAAAAVGDGLPDDLRPGAQLGADA